MTLRSRAIYGIKSRQLLNLKRPSAAQFLDLRARGRSAIDGRRADNVSVIQPRSRGSPSCNYEESCCVTHLHPLRFFQGPGLGNRLPPAEPHNKALPNRPCDGSREEELLCGRANDAPTSGSSDRYVAIRVGGFADGDDECCCCGMQFDPLLWSDSELRSCPGVADTASQRARLQLATHGYELFSSCSYCHIYMQH